MTRSLAPDRTDRTSLAALASAPVVLAGIERIDRAIERHFPDNLFADLDRIASRIERVRVDRGDEAALAYADRIASLHARFGCETVLAFRYAHDFLYGFDWARWVARDPAGRVRVGPYDEPFLDYSERRAAELVTLVSQNDHKYGPLARGAHRNPFPFRRDLDAERALHLALARDAAIPVCAWDPCATDVWDRDYAALREAKAQALGLVDAVSSD